MKSLVEAALFVSPSPLSRKELSKLSGLDVDSVDRIISELNEAYASVGSVLRIERIGDSYRMVVPSHLYDRVKKYAGIPEFTERDLKVVAYVYSKDSVLRSEIRKRFRNADTVLEKLLKFGLISMRKKRNTYEIVKTPLFYKYFKKP